MAEVTWLNENSEQNASLKSVHEDIAELLERLRSSAGQQITIEVRFVSLGDDFFERMGIDFDLDVEDTTTLLDDIPVEDEEANGGLGPSPAGLPSSDLDFRIQNAPFALSSPFENPTDLDLGFAILCDIEAFFFLQAARADGDSGSEQGESDASDPTVVRTTVSVPDGGTILLGGIKRLSTDGLEAGVPLLNRLPYVNRLFKNAGAADSSSLMMLVTPRIIIQQEEE